MKRKDWIGTLGHRSLISARCAFTLQDGFGTFRLPNNDEQETLQLFAVLILAMFNVDFS